MQVLTVEKMFYDKIENKNLYRLTIQTVRLIEDFVVNYDGQYFVLEIHLYSVPIVGVLQGENRRRLLLSVLHKAVVVYSV